MPALNLPLELVNRILYFASLHGDKKYIPVFQNTGKLYWKLNFQHTVFDRLNKLCLYRSLNPVKTYNRVTIHPSLYGMMVDTFIGFVFPVCETENTYTELLSLEHTHADNGENDVCPNIALVKYSKPKILDGLSMYVEYVDGTLYTNTMFHSHNNQAISTIIDIERVKVAGNELTLSLNTTQYWQYNPILNINEYIFNFGFDEDGPEEFALEPEGPTLVDWDDVVMDDVVMNNAESNVM